VPHRLVITLTLAVAALCLAATAVAESTATPRIARGGTFRIKLKTQSLAVCVAIVNYRGGALQLGATKYANDGRLAWTFPVARSRPLGRATWEVRCGLPVERTGAFVVVNPPSAG